MDSTHAQPTVEAGVPNQAGGAIVTDAQRRKRILIATCTALMAVMASSSGVGVAQQELALDLGASQSTVLWIINGYTVVLAALLLPVGAIGDRWGRRPVLVTGLVVFGAASVAAGFAGSSAFLIAVRALAGVGAAMIMPATLSVITSSFPEEHRAQAIGIWAGVAGGGGLIGMVASAVLVDVASWRWLFALPVALVAGALVMSLASIPNSHERIGGSFDIGGSVLSLLAVGGLVLAIHEGPEQGWTAPVSSAAAVVGVSTTVGFWMWERRRQHPLLDVTVFRDRRLSAGSLALLVVFGVLAGVFIVLFPYFQAVLGFSAIRSTVALLPMALVMMASSGLAPRPAKRFGTRVTMLVGVGMAAGGLALMASLVSVEGGYLSVLPGMIVIGMGMGLVMTPSTESITASLPSTRQGVASAINDTTREIGTALGVALLGTVLSASYRSAIETRLDAFPDQTADVAAEGIASAFGVAAQVGGDDAETLVDAARHAFVEGWTTSMWMGVAAMGALFACILLSGPRDDAEPAQAAVAAATARGDGKASTSSLS